MHSYLEYACAVSVPCVCTQFILVGVVSWEVKVQKSVEVQLSEVQLEIVQSCPKLSVQSCTKSKMAKHLLEEFLIALLCSLLRQWPFVCACVL